MDLANRKPWTWVLRRGDREHELEFVGAHGVLCVSRASGDDLRLYHVRCHVCNTNKAAKLSIERWSHYMQTLASRRCYELFTLLMAR